MLEELKAKAKTALEAGDDVAFMSVVAEINKAKADIAKAQAVQALKEATELAGVREALELEIFKAVKALKLDKSIKEVKAYGFTYKVDRVDTSVVPPLTTKETRAYMVVPMVKTVKVSGAGSSGKSKVEFGMSLGEIFNRFATDDDKAKLAAATSNSVGWQIKTAVKKAALAAGKIAPVK